MLQWPSIVGTCWRGVGSTTTRSAWRSAFGTGLTACYRKTGAVVQRSDFGGGQLGDVVVVTNGVSLSLLQTLLQLGHVELICVDKRLG